MQNLFNYILKQNQLITQLLFRQTLLQTLRH